jgi:hypothetical protein
MFTLSVQRGPYLLATATGSADLTDLTAAVMCIAEVARRARSQAVIIDLLAVTTNLSAADHEELGRFLARVLAGIRVASVVPSSERIGTSERVAVACGLVLRTFTDLIEAEAWTAEQSPVAGTRRNLA